MKLKTLTFINSHILIEYHCKQKAEINVLPIMFLSFFKKKKKI